MILINLSHPLTEGQRTQIEDLAQQSITRLIERMPHFVGDVALGEQVATLISDLGLTSAEWQSSPLLLNPPGFSPATAAVLAEVHGRCGYFPPVVRLRPVPDSLPPRFEVAELLNLQAQREQARQRRGEAD